MPENILISIVGFFTSSLVFMLMWRGGFRLKTRQEWGEFVTLWFIYLALFVILPYSGEVAAVKAEILSERRERVSDVGLLLEIREKESYYNGYVAEDWIDRISRRFSALEQRIGDANP